MSQPPRSLTRRAFLSTAGALTFSLPLQSLLGRYAAGAALNGDGYGPLELARDESTGLRLLKLPRGFRYTTFSWAGDRLDDGTPTPSMHDGMAAFPGEHGRILLVRNHELSADSGAMAARATYDQAASAGTTTLEFDPAEGRLRSASASLAGTLRNCAGGPTPWGSWLTCEETVRGPGAGARFRRKHGYVFEVPLQGRATADPLVAMGRFVHEATAIDPASGVVYETEDHIMAGFYRFVPKAPGELGAGGRLEMLAIKGQPRFDTRRGQRIGAEHEVTWVPIADPDRAHHGPEETDSHGVFQQGLAEGGAIFARLEGAWAGDGRILFNATTGGNAGGGQIWEHTPATQTLRLVFESPGLHVLNHPDNLCLSPRGGLAICEDGEGPQFVRGLTPDGRIFPFAENAVMLRGEKNRIRGDFSTREFAGSCFSPDGEWLFFNVQTPGFTVAVTGPWGTGML